MESLLKQSIYPIIIYIKPKDKKARKFRCRSGSVSLSNVVTTSAQPRALDIRQALNPSETCVCFRKLLLGYREEDLIGACQMEELQLETLPVMFSTVEPNTWSCTDELLAVIRSTILSQQSAMVWLELESLQ